MGTEIRLTSGPTRVTSTTTQAAKDALDVVAYSAVDLYVVVYEAGGTPSITISIETSMQNTVDDSALWKDLGSFTAVTSSNAIEVKSYTTGLLRYIRYKVTLDANTTAATFELSGVARAG